MIFRPLASTCPFSRPAQTLAISVGFCLTLSACSLIGVEPDEIDYAPGDSETGEQSSTGHNGTEGDPGDGDGDPGDGDGDGSPGDGDGSPGDGDGDAGDGDGDGSPGDGDGDGDPIACEEFGAVEVVDGSNPVAVVDGDSLLMGSCGADGPESVYVYTAANDALITFTLLDAEFDAVMLLVDQNCEPLQELACVTAPDLQISQMMSQGQSLYIVVDSAGGLGNATLEITGG